MVRAQGLPPGEGLSAPVPAHRLPSRALGMHRGHPQQPQSVGAPASGCSRSHTRCELAGWEKAEGPPEEGK